MTGVHIYNTSVSRRQYTKQANQSTCERTSQGVAIHALSTLGSLPANGLSVYLQSELSLLSTAAGPSARWVSADLQPMTHTNPGLNYVRTPRVAQVEQWAFFYPFHPKPQYSSTKNNHWNSGTMRIRYCGFEDNRRNAMSGVSIKERYAICTVPAFHRRKNTLLSGGFEWNSSKIGHCSTRANISGVIV